jgi:hypothetical protein
MTGDIVERLRRMAPHPSAYDEREAAMLNETERREAADGIERLREALATCRELREIDKALIAKLRAPLNVQGGSET